MAVSTYQRSDEVLSTAAQVDDEAEHVDVTSMGKLFAVNARRRRASCSSSASTAMYTPVRPPPSLHTDTLRHCDVVVHVYRLETRARFSKHLVGLLQLRFERDSATTRYEMRTIRARFEHDTTSYEELCAFEQ